MLPPTHCESETPPSNIASLDADTLLDQLVETCVVDLPVALETLHPLNLQQLSAFEPVTAQFSQQGVTFADAIALSPSNPKFIEQPGQKALMPTTQHRRRHQLQLWLQPTVKQVCLAGRSTQSILVEVLDAAGTVVAVQNGITCPLPNSLQHDTSRLPSQVFKLKLPESGALRLSSKAPFVVFNIAI